MFKVYIKHALESRFSSSKERTFASLELAEDHIAKSRPENTSSHWQIRSEGRVVLDYPACTDPRAVEPVVGSNLQVMRNIIGRMHVGRSNLEVVRAVIREAMGMGHFRKLPKQLKRGLIVAACEIHRENRGLYKSVMSGSF